MEKVIDLTREEGARVLEEELLLYPVARKVVDNFGKVITNRNNNRSDGKNKKEEYYSTNFFIDGKRGTGKTSVLLTVRKILGEMDNIKKNVEPLEIINLSVNQSGILLHVLSHINFKLENDPPASCRSTELHDLFSKVKMGYPYYLKCSLEKAFEKLCELEIEELLDRLEGDFLQNLRKLITEYKRIYGKDIVIFIDDLDLVQDGKFLYRSFLEMAAFLCLEHVHIIAAGDLENTYSILRKVIKDLTEDKEANDFIVQSFIDKVFPLHNRTRLHLLSVSDLQELKVKTSSQENQSLEDFLIQHPTFRILSERGRKKVLYYLFEGLPLREMVQLLQSIKGKIEFLKNKINKDEKIKMNISEISVSNIFSKFSSEEYHSILEIPPNTNIIVELNLTENGEIEVKFPSRIDDIKNLYSYNEELAKKLFLAILKFSQSENGKKFKEQFQIEFSSPIVDLRERRKLSLLQTISVIDRKFYALLLLWLIEILNFNNGCLFFIPYLLLLESFIYGIPNIFLYLEGRLRDGREDILYRNPFEELEYISHFVDIENLMYTLYSLDTINVKKHYPFKENEIEEFIPFHNLTANKAKVIPYFYKFWFLPIVVLEGQSEIEKWIHYEPFLTEEVENSPNQEELSGQEETIRKRNGKKIFDNLRELVQKAVSLQLGKPIDPLEVDRQLFSFFKSLSQRILKSSGSIKVHSQTKIALYYLLSLAFPIIAYEGALKDVKETSWRDLILNIVKLAISRDNYANELCKFLRKFTSSFEIEIAVHIKAKIQLQKKTKTQDQNGESSSSINGTNSTKEPTEIEFEEKEIVLTIKRCNDFKLENLKESSDLREKIQIAFGKKNKIDSNGEQPKVKVEKINRISVRSVKLRITDDVDVITSYILLFLSKLYSNITIRDKITIELENSIQITEKIKEKFQSLPNNYEKAVLKLMFYLVTVLGATEQK